MNNFIFNPSLESIMDLIENNSKKSIEYGRLEIFSYSGGTFLQDFIGTVFGGWLFFFYEIEMGLNIWMLSIGFIIYAVWNAVNSPLIGYYTGKKRILKSKFGRRFPWLLISAIPWMLSLYFLYNPPFNELNLKSDMVLLFFWFLIFLCLLSLFGTIFGINYNALYPEKFQSEAVRRRASGIIGGISFLGSGFGSFLPALIITYGDKSSFAHMAAIMILIGTTVFILAIPGFWEYKEMREKNIKLHQKNNELNFLESMKLAAKQKNFLIYVVLYFFIQFVMISVGAAFPYAVRYIFQKEAIYTAYLALLYVVGAIISLPIWTFINKKLNDNKKSLLITGVFLLFSQIAIFFTFSISMAVFTVFFFGFCLAGFRTILSLRIVGNVFDEIVVNTGRRNESTYMGISGFFINFTVAVQSLVFALVHELTGFGENVEVQTDLAQLGIRLTLSLIPLVFIFLGLLIFWKYYDLTPEKVQTIEQKLKILNEK